MKRISIAILSISFLALTACDQGTSTSSETSDSTKVKNDVQSVNTGTLKFAYVNTDSLSNSFDMIKDFEEEILQERLQMESQLQGMVKKLEKDYTDAQAGAAGLSEEALAILQQKLAQQEQQVMQQKNAMEQKLMRTEQEKTDLYLSKVQSFLDEYARAEGYDIIYGYNGLNNVLYIDKAYDITGEVIDSLNSVYQTEKSQPELQAKK